VIYLDTGCLLKLYYPEPESAAVARLATGQPIVYVGVHDLELTNALELKLFRKEARPAQVRAVRALVEDDLRAGVLHRATLPWDDVVHDARELAERHTRRLGCRSLDVLHCAAARRLAPTAFVTTDARQRRLALAIGLRCPAI
jgi:predicted nucleic acid-binding protein